MLRVKPALTFAESDSKRRAKLVLSLALMLAGSFLGAGCNTLPRSSASSQPSAQSAEHISIQTLLPTAIVGSNYHQVLSVSGGQPPYTFAVSQGELPPGLTLNPQTGNISGTPTRAGSFAFTILVSGAPTGRLVLPGDPLGNPLGDTGARAYTVTVVSCANCVTVQISPANASVAAGGQVQFAALVSNTSNTAVTWAASAGSMSANGLFTAPGSTGAKGITVTASSVAEPAAQASAPVTIAGSEFTITTSSVPLARVSKPYTELLTARGGQLPYQWRILSGSLPAGLQLSASTGTLTGSTTQVGTFPFTIEVTDAAGLHTQQTLSLDVSATNLCGPPTYNCSRTDFNITPVPASTPNVGTLVGANMIATDPDFANRIVRVTDWNTDPAMPADGRTWVSASSGSSNENIWNTDSTLFIVQAIGAAGYPFSFNPSTMQASRLYVASNPTNGGLRLNSGGGYWSRTDPNVLYTTSGTVISKYDFSDRTNVPSPQVVYDFTSGKHCLPAGFTATWFARGDVSSGDAVFGMVFSNNGSQGTGVYAVAYKPGSGCTMLNTQTGQVTGDFGSAGTINITDRWTIHNAKVSLDGNWMMISAQNCTSSSCSAGPYFWQIGTTTVNSCGQGKRCGGHMTLGHTHYINNPNNGDQVSRLFSAPTTVEELSPIIPPGVAAPLDEHPSWNNADPADSLPFLLSTWSPTTPFPAPWYDEITGVSVDGSGKVWRFAHNFITGKSQIFCTEYGIGSVSQDGRFFLWSSDWMGHLGSQSGAQTCTVGKDCRGDVFVVELQ
jgi:hypothetical protein